MSDDSMWIERAQSWEAKYKTLESQSKPALERVKQFKTNFGVKEASDGSISIDFEKLVERLGLESSMELRRIIDERWNISGAVGEKPKVRIRAGA